MRKKPRAQNADQKPKPKGKKKEGPEVVDQHALEAERDAMVEREYRLGQLSIAQIGRQAGGLSRQAIEKRAKKGGWIRDLMPLVQAKVKQRLLRDAAPEGADVTEAVSAAAERAVGIVLAHRTSLARLDRITNNLMVTLELFLEKKIKRIPWQMLGESLPSMVSRLAQAQAKVCMLQRQAFGVDAEPEKAPSEPVKFIMNFVAPAPAGPEVPADVASAAAAGG